MKPILIVVGVTPGALAVLPAPDAELVEAVLAPEVAVELFFEELLHADATSASNGSATAA
jgi:hypothetical protein